MKHAKLAAALAVIIMMTVIAAPAVTAEDSVDLTATVLEPKPEIGIELSTSALNFGSLYPGNTSEDNPLKVTSIGLKTVDVTAEASDDGSEPLFVPGLMIDGNGVAEYKCTLATDEFDDMMLALHVPDDYASRGDVSGGATFWAEEHLDASPVTDFNYTNDGVGVTITGYSGLGGDVIIPSIIDGLPVTTIEDHAFDGIVALTTVTIPNSVSTVGGQVFSGCTALTSAYIGSGAISIATNAFVSCPALTAIYVDPSNTAYASVDGVLYMAGNTLIKCPEGKIGSVVIPSGITTINDYAFQDCVALTSVTIPDSVTNMGIQTFSGCISLTTVTIGSSVTSIGNNEFRYCVALTSVNIPDSVTTIKEVAFYQCSALSSITIGSGVTSIGQSAFRECTSLASLTFEGNAPTVGSNWAKDSTNMVVFYQQDATGFTTPTWEGVPCYPIAKTWTVDNDRVEYPAADFTTISEAIAAASAGDTVKVYAGTYAGSITIDKTLTVEGVGLPVIDDGQSGNMGVSITAQDVVFKGFKVTNTASLCFGIWINANGVTVEGCTIDGCNEGIVIDSCSGVTIKQNTISNCWGWVGLYVNAEGNQAYLNNFVSNPSGDIYTYGGSISLSTPAAVDYTYNGNTFSGYLGNYYSGFSGADVNGNGVVDSANGSDMYPLVMPVENYGL